MIFEYIASSSNSSDEESNSTTEEDEENQPEEHDEVELSPYHDFRQLLRSRPKKLTHGDIFDVKFENYIND